MSKRVLVVEDDPDILDYLSELLKTRGFVFIGAESGASALQKIEKTFPNLVVLDLKLPDIPGETVLTQMRDKYPHLPVIVVTGKDELESKVKTFQLGADDYVTKPFIPDELIARINTRLRDVIGEETLRVGDLVLDQNTFEVERAGKPIKLTKTEFKLLEFLMRNQGKVLKRELILNHVWGYTPDIDSRAVDVYIGYLRRKVCFSFGKRLIHTSRGFGYVLKAE